MIVNIITKHVTRFILSIILEIKWTMYKNQLGHKTKLPLLNVGLPTQLQKIQQTTIYTA